MPVGSCGFVDVTQHGAHRVHMAASALWGPPKPSKCILCKLWAGGFFVICSNHTITLFLGTMAE